MTDPTTQSAGMTDERAAFEEWASDRSIYPRVIRRKGDGYHLARTQSFWRAWQARAALSASSPSPAGEPYAHVPTAVIAALDRMCSPLHESRLSGVTAEQDARCMKTIRDYILSPPSVSIDLSRVRDVGEPTDAMVQAYLDAQRAAVEEADRFGRPNIGGLHTNTVREACRAGLRAALAIQQSACEYCDDTGDVHGLDGEWRGVCVCAAGHAIATRAAQQSEVSGVSAVSEEFSQWLNAQRDQRVAEVFHDIIEKYQAASHWEQTARVQNAKLMAMTDGETGFKKLCEVMDRYRDRPAPGETATTQAPSEDQIKIGVWSAIGAYNAQEIGLLGVYDRIRALAAPVPSTAAGERAPSDAVRDVLAERQRQISVEGWTPEHDDEHSWGEMARAGAAYAAQSLAADDAELECGPPAWWPRDWTWKPASRRRMLVKGAALILAEIERIDRAAATPPPQASSTGGGV